ncbi:MULTISPECIES: type II toxin-antitoxin system RelE/ParE family toxin [unclassified Gordonia (in: high G+C Gram-positive bacteria)]|uniref:type II toxin-antitoxin system RelE family toxin n=1 Tax=unclassified Gordonia (in: high G+C Gram-positive bacteria) TaxID=2657482 RepID=UPI0009AC1233|nr:MULTISPECIES: type II toxin-antitoxin system RelE/ParE family toxin [unclassified Gordonia (in: high G+C Gram-positive bacteria)]MDF3281593.1 type II toxin-antitoxin system RelE/ParE family toxin [Gordonia sp. N1V]OPX17301.1 addiction module toxin RelE [Gordonia sp. i37]
MSEDAVGSPDPYRVEVAFPARRDLQRLPSRIVHAVIEFISGPLAENPHRLSKPLRDELDGLRSARRGDYRVLLRIDESGHTIIIVRIDHRAHAYRA